MRYIIYDFINNKTIGTNLKENDVLKFLKNKKASLNIKHIKEYIRDKTSFNNQYVFLDYDKPKSEYDLNDVPFAYMEKCKKEYINEIKKIIPKRTAIHQLDESGNILQTFLSYENASLKTGYTSEKIRVDIHRTFEKPTNPKFCKHQDYKEVLSKFFEF